MVRFVGFLRALLIGSFNGDVGADRACEASNGTGAVIGLLIAGISIFSVSFLRFFVPSWVDSNDLEFAGSGLLCCANRSCVSFGTMFAGNGFGGAIEFADSGDADAELSDISGESKVEFVPVGEDSSVDSENNEV